MRYLTKAVASAMPHPSPDSSLTKEHAEPATRLLSKKLALCGRRLKDKRPPESISSSSSTAEFYASHSGTGAGQSGTRRRLLRGASRQSSGLGTRALRVTAARSFAASPAWGPLVDALRRQGVSFEHEIFLG